MNMANINLLDDEQFLQLLEKNLGRRWPKHWRARIWNLAPTPKDKHIRSTCCADQQQQALDHIRERAAQIAMARLSN